MTPLELLLTKLPGAKKSGRGWSARCPAHDTVSHPFTRFHKACETVSYYGEKTCGGVSQFHTISGVICAHTRAVCRLRTPGDEFINPYRIRVY